MFVIHRRGCRPLVSTADLIAVKRIGTLTYVEFAHEGQPSSTIASSEITRVEVIV
jgi:hypothetical protein